MNNKKQRTVPKEEQYKVKYVFKEDSNIDINNVIKECFIKKINMVNIKKITL